jgi:hypothetical protein
VGYAYVIPSSVSKSPDALPILALMRIDSAGTPVSSTRGRLGKHSAISSFGLAPMADGGFALAGYFSGALRLGGAEIRSVTPASEAVFLAVAGSGSDFEGRAFQGPQLQAGLSIHSGAPGTVLLTGWLCGTMMLGAQKIASPSDRAALFVATLPAA